MFLLCVSTILRGDLGGCSRPITHTIRGCLSLCNDLGSTVELKKELSEKGGGSFQSMSQTLSISKISPHVPHSPVEHGSNPQNHLSKGNL